jgi:RNA polymerase sigma-70 factor (ECF subfamily)
VSTEAGRDLVLREFVRHRSSLFAVTLSLVRDFAFAEEVLQEIAVVICDQWSDFKPGTNFQAWAMRIARNKIYTLTREARRVILLSPLAMEGIEHAAAAETRQGWLEAVQNCMEGLEERARTILSLRYQQGLSGQAIAHQLQMTVTAVHMALSRARTSVARCAEGRLAGGEPSP